jgi:hypothetical protein
LESDILLPGSINASTEKKLVKKKYQSNCSLIFFISFKKLLFMKSIYLFGTILLLAISSATFGQDAQESSGDNNSSSSSSETTVETAPDPIMSALQDNIENLNRISNERASQKVGENIEVQQENVNTSTTPKPYPYNNSNSSVQGTNEQGLYRLTPEKTDNGQKRNMKAGNAN